MGNLVLAGATSGSTTIQPTDAVTTTLTLPATSGTLTVGGTTPSFTSVTTNQLTIGTTQLGAGNASIMKNRIINGAMVISQAAAGASVAGANLTYAVDRFQGNTNVSSKFTMQQNAGSVTPPVGFTKYLGLTSSSAYTIGASEYCGFIQGIEGLNIADLGWGTANAKTVTLSFQVYSSLTGTFGGSIFNGGANRSYPFSYSIPVANTWTTISITVAGDTTGTWATDNSVGMYINFSIGAGSTASGTAGSWSGTFYRSATGATSVVGTSGATFYITGVQLEVGSSATGFEYRQYGQEFALCQRYYIRNTGTTAGMYLASGGVASATVIRIVLQNAMRATPTINYAATLTIDDGSVAPTVTSVGSIVSFVNGITFQAIASGGGMTLGRAGGLRSSNTTDWFDLSAEL